MHMETPAPAARPRFRLPAPPAPLRRGLPWLLLLAGWLLAGPALWRVLSAAAAAPGGPAALFLAAGALWIVSLAAASAVRARRTGREEPLGLVRLSSSAPPDVLRRRALHEAAHAVAGWGMGGRILSLEIRRVDDHGGQCLFDLDRITDPADRNWALLVICMAGNQVDLAHGHLDDGAQADIVQGMVAAASIISTGCLPRGYRGPLTTDALLAAARDRADDLLARHQRMVDGVVRRLLADPDAVWRDPDLPAAGRAAAA